MDAGRLKKIDVFSSLDDEHLGHLAEVAEETEISSGDKLTKAGAHSYQLFAIESGEVEVKRSRSPTGRSSAARTRSCGSTAKSAAAPTSSASSPTTKR